MIGRGLRDDRHGPDPNACFVAPRLSRSSRRPGAGSPGRDTVTIPPGSGRAVAGLGGALCRTGHAPAGFSRPSRWRHPGLQGGSAPAASKRAARCECRNSFRAGDPINLSLAGASGASTGRNGSPPPGNVSTRRRDALRHGFLWRRGLSSAPVATPTTRATSRVPQARASWTGRWADKRGEARRARGGGREGYGLQPIGTIADTRSDPSAAGTSMLGVPIAAPRASSHRPVHRGGPSGVRGRRSWRGWRRRRRRPRRWRRRRA